MVDCCNVARCNIDDNTCSVGLHNHPIEYARGEPYMVKEQLMVDISGKFNVFVGYRGFTTILLVNVSTFLSIGMSLVNSNKY